MHHPCILGNLQDQHTYIIWRICNIPIGSSMEFVRCSSTKNQNPMSLISNEMLLEDIVLVYEYDWCITISMLGGHPWCVVWIRANITNEVPADWCSYRIQFPVAPRGLDWMFVCIFMIMLFSRSRYSLFDTTLFTFVCCRISASLIDPSDFPASFMFWFSKINW